MKIQVTIKPNAKKEEVSKLPDGSFRVSVKAPPIDGKANEALRGALSKYFSCPKSSVVILHGFKGKKKIVEIS